MECSSVLLTTSHLSNTQNLPGYFLIFLWPTLLALSLFPTCYKTFIARFEVANLLTHSWYIQKWENSTIIKIFSKFRSKVLYFLPQLVILKKVSWDFKDLFQWYLPFAHFYLLPWGFPGGTSGKERKKESEFSQSCPTLWGPHGL